MSTIRGGGAQFEIKANKHTYMKLEVCQIKPWIILFSLIDILKHGITQILLFFMIGFRPRMGSLIVGGVEPVEASHFP